MKTLDRFLKKRSQIEDAERVGVEYHDTLNPDLWDEFTLKPEVRDKLLEIADHFAEFLEVPIDVVNVVMTGSNANFNWTNLSDIDLHLIVDLTETRGTCPDLVSKYLWDKKKIWNDVHGITIYGFNVELYAQDVEEGHVASGVYSLVDDDWIVQPEYQPPDIDDMAIQSKAAELKDRIDELTEGGCSEPEAIEELKERIRTLRQTGLQQAGEFSTENLVFKVLRNTGYLKKLSQCQDMAIDESLSLK